jgi:hypothetical protein
MVVVLLSAAVLAWAPVKGADQSAEAPLQLEGKIPLGNVRGRIDHMAIDPKRQRLFVAELGNDTVGVVDLSNRKLLRRISGLKESRKASAMSFPPIPSTSPTPATAQCGCSRGKSIDPRARSSWAATLTTYASTLRPTAL